MDGRFGKWWLAGLLGFYLVLAAVIPTLDDEVYYWCWSKELQWSYYDHPPMTAYLMFLSTSLFRDSKFGYRIPACIASVFVVYVMNRLTRSKMIVAGAMCSPLFTLGAPVMTPDSPLVASWAAYLWWLTELHRRLDHAATDVETVGGSTSGASSVHSSAVDLNDRPNQLTWQWWLVGGVLLGCGALSKYTMGLAVPAAFVSLLACRRPWREWFPGYVFHGVISFAVASPILIYNAQRQFAPLLFQLRHTAEMSPSGLQTFGDFVGVQMLLFGTLPITLFPWVLFNFRRLCQTPRLRVCTSLYAIPMAFFLYKSTQARLEGNWALVCYVSFWPLASDWYESVRTSRFWRSSTEAAFLPPAICVMLLTIHRFFPIPVVPLKGDRLHRQIAINAAVGEVSQRIRELNELLPVYTDSYQMTAHLRFNSVKAQQIDDPTQRASHFTQTHQHLTDVSRAYVISEIPLKPELSKGFSEPTKVASVAVNYRGTTDRTMNVWLYSR